MSSDPDLRAGSASIWSRLMHELGPGFAERAAFTMPTIASSQKISPNSNKRSVCGGRAKTARRRGRNVS